MSAHKEELDALHPDERALLEPAEQVLYKFQRIDTNARQDLYLNAWRGFYDSCRNYLFPDDRAANEFGPCRTEDVSALSYERTAHAVKQKRAQVIQANKERLVCVLATATESTTNRNKLAHECHNTARRLNQYADVFAELDAQSYSPHLPPFYSSQPERRVDEPASVGAALGLLDFLGFVLAQFWMNEVPLIPLPLPKGTPAADVRRYFPQAATIQGSTASDANALYQLAVWLLHWAERPSGERYSLPGQLRKRIAALPHAGKFLKACERLHEALTPLAATEQDTKALLGKEYTAHSRNNLQAVLTWWAGWIREQRALIPPARTPVDAYLEALQRVPLNVEWVNGSPRYIVPLNLLDSTRFAADIRPLLNGFKAAIPTLSPVHLRHLRAQFGELLLIDPERFKRQREWFERQQYSLEFLPEDYEILNFEVAGDPNGLADSLQWVGPSFWTDIIVLVLNKQEAARSAFNALNKALDETVPAPAPQPIKTLAPPTADPVTEWENLLKKGVSFTLADLDALLVQVKLLSDAASRTATPEFRGAAIVGVIEALRERHYLTRKNNAKLARILAERYGEESANPHTVGRTYDPAVPDKAHPFYTVSLALLPAR